MGWKSHEYIGNGGLITYNKVITAREVLKNYEVDTLQKDLYAYAPNGDVENNTAQVDEITTTDHSKIAIAHVSILFKKNFINLHIHNA